MSRKRDRPTSWASAAAKRIIDLAGPVQNVEQAVQTIVERLLADADIPADLDKIAARFGVAAIRAADLPFSGELRRVHGAYEIVYASHLSPERKRFTIAHEIGHAVLQSSGKGAPRHGVELERICDKFAAELLMPAAHFRANCGAAPSMSRVLHLSKIYRTSLSSTAIRFAQLFGATTFEVSDGEISWAYGVITKGPLARKDPTLQESISALLTNKKDADVLPYTTRQWSGQWRLEAHRLGAKRGLFLFRPQYTRPAVPAGS